jgi:hypothetical protein
MNGMERAIRGLEDAIRRLREEMDNLDKTPYALECIRRAE